MNTSLGFTLLSNSAFEEVFTALENYLTVVKGDLSDIQFAARCHMEEKRLSPTEKEEVYYFDDNPIFQVKYVWDGNIFRISGGVITEK